MPLLIDGYNLLHVTGITGRGNDLTALHRSRQGLLQFLAASIEPAEREQTTIVFDAVGAPPGLPKTFVHDAITVHFARDYADADAMIEELIAAHTTPRSLTVVSSDHRIQRAARRRRAMAVDSDRWYADLWAARHHRQDASSELPVKPGDNLSEGEVNFWLKQFDEGSPDESLPSPLGSPASDKRPPATDIENPFPPGYADDLFDDTD